MAGLMWRAAGRDELVGMPTRPETASRQTGGIKRVDAAAVDERGTRRGRGSAAVHRGGVAIQIERGVSKNRVFLEREFAHQTSHWKVCSGPNLYRPNLHSKTRQSSNRCNRDIWERFNA